MNRARSKYYSAFISDNSSNQGKLFRAAKSLLSVPKTLPLPVGCDTEKLANDLGDFFVQKVTDIHMRLNYTVVPSVTVEFSTSCPDVSFTEFKVLYVLEVRDLVTRATKKSSCLDPMPTSLVVQCLDELLPVITSMVNLSLQSGHVAKEWKEAIASPLLKKEGTDLLFKNLRPVSNLAYISKLTETAVACYPDPIPHVSTRFLPSASISVQEVP